MNKYLKIDPWCIIEEGFDPKNHKASESIFSLGNGQFGQRANFEEIYSGDSLQGNYVAGIYYPDKTKVGWWKNGYPEYFAKVLNAPNWIGIDIQIDGEMLDLAQCKIKDFTRILHMKEAYLHRKFTIELPSGKQLKANVTRFLSISMQEVGAIRYTITPINFDGIISVSSYIDAGIKNADANYDELFWDEVRRDAKGSKAFITSRTRKTGFDVCMGIDTRIPSERSAIPSNSTKEKFVAIDYQFKALKGIDIVIEKYASVLSSMYHAKEDLRVNAEKVLDRAVIKGFDALFSEHKLVWADKWEHSDIVIEGDPEAQQGIRFNIFQLNQTYTGQDERLNVGPKGFTGEKYGGSTYWDTEAYCLPFFLCTAPAEVSRNLLVYRYKHLAKAVENGQKLGFTNGAALYPMVTMNGEECHNEWEITFEEIHRNGAIAHAIYNYIKHTGESHYLVDFGLEVLIGISRFWRQRITFSESKKKYVMLGVTGPNEYENNVHNNWYTNTIATWTLTYTIEALSYVKGKELSKYKTLCDRIQFNASEETSAWEDIIEHMYYPVDNERGVFVQQDGYLDKEQLMSDEIDPKQRPINQHWSWDRILRSCFIKQADVLQGIYLFEDRYDTDTIRRNFDFYEPRTVHESSLSPCVHAILAARIGNIDKAYELYLRTSRLDLDDYNDEVDEGLHITSMGGTWMSVIEGFAGKRIRKGKLILNPHIPGKWKSYSFKLMFMNSLLRIVVNSDNSLISNESGVPVDLLVYEQEIHLEANSTISITNKSVSISN